MSSISVALCTYNGAKFLRQQLDSLAAQTVSPMELVICDDGSTDDTLNIVSEFARSSIFPVRLVGNSERLGYSRNFLKAVGLCDGDLIACCDQDDIWYPNKLEASSKSFIDDTVVLSYHAVDLIDADGKPIRRYNDRAPGRNIMPPLTMSPWIFGMGFTITLRKSLRIGMELADLTFDQHIPDKPISHDQWFTFLASVFGSIAYVETSLAGYRQHSTNVFGAMRPLIPPPKSLPEKLRQQTDEFDRCSRSCESRAKILRLLNDALPKPLGQRASNGAAAYAQLGNMFYLRKKIYASQSVPEKLKLIAQLRSAGGYHDKKPWAFGRKAMIKDLALSVVTSGQAAMRLP